MLLSEEHCPVAKKLDTYMFQKTLVFWLAAVLLRRCQAVKLLADSPNTTTTTTTATATSPLRSRWNIGPQKLSHPRQLLRFL
jgi:hypothetical protein